MGILGTLAEAAKKAAGSEMVRRAAKRAAENVAESRSAQDAAAKVMLSGTVRTAVEKVDTVAGYGANAALAVIRDMANRKIERYGEIKSLRRDEEGYHAIVQLLGSADLLEVTMLDITLNEDCSMATLGAFTANEEWLACLLDDYAKGREVPIPEGAVRQTLKKIPGRYL